MQPDHGSMWRYPVPALPDSWRRRYALLVLFTPRACSALPGLGVPGDPKGFPTKDEMANYLETYANYFDLPVLLGTATLLGRRGPGGSSGFAL